MQIQQAKDQNKKAEAKKKELERMAAALRSAMSRPSQKASARGVYSSIRCMSWVIIKFPQGGGFFWALFCLLENPGNNRFETAQIGRAHV